MVDNEGITKKVAFAYATVFKSEAGAVVLDHLEHSLNASATVELTPFQQGQASAFRKIRAWIRIADEIVQREDRERRG